MRKTSVSKIASLFVLSLVISGTSGAKEVTDTPQKIYYVDMQKALQSVDAGKKAKAQLEKDFNSRKKELQSEEEKIKKATEAFKKQSDVMTDESRAKKQAELQERILKFQEQTARSQAEIQQKERELTQPIVEKLKSIIEEIGEKKSATVLEKGAVLSAPKDLDLTDEVISNYNKQSKSS